MTLSTGPYHTVKHSEYQLLVEAMGLSQGRPRSHNLPCVNQAPYPFGDPFSSICMRVLAPGIVINWSLVMGINDYWHCIIHSKSYILTVGLPHDVSQHDMETILPLPLKFYANKNPHTMSYRAGNSIGYGYRYCCPTDTMWNEIWLTVAIGNMEPVCKLKIETVRIDIED